MNITNCCTLRFSYILNCSNSIEELHFAALFLQAALHFSCLSFQMDNETKMLLQLMIQTSSRCEHWTINKLEQWPNTGFLAIAVVLEHTILEHPTQLLHAPQLCCYNFISSTAYTKCTLCDKSLTPKNNIKLLSWRRRKQTNIKSLSWTIFSALNFNSHNIYGVTNHFNSHKLFHAEK